MDCCGKTKVLMNVVEGKVNRAIGKENQFTQQRSSECEKCENVTWFTKKEYREWVRGKYFKIIKYIDKPKVMPPLTIQKKTDGREMYCSICKCLIDEKTRVKQNTCPEKLWIQ